MVNTKTLYSYVDLGLLNIRNHHLPEKLIRNTKQHNNRANEKKLGRSIEERPVDVNERKKFGHRECDLVLGAKTSGDEALFTLIERKSREYWMIPIPDKSTASVMKVVEQLRKEYGDIVGWIKVKGTRIDYPVMQTPKNPEFYLRRNFEKKYSIAGTPFLDAASDVDKSKNFLIYGHNIKSGTMFHQLLRYEKQNFYNNHKTFTYDQLVRGQQVNGTYEVIAAFRTQIFPANSKAFKYNHYPLIIDQKKYERYVKDCISRSSVDTGKTADWDKQMVTLSTCAYHVENGRFVVVGARIN